MSNLERRPFAIEECLRVIERLLRERIEHNAWERLKEELGLDEGEDVEP
jgi:hypothetical protein